MKNAVAFIKNKLALMGVILLATAVGGVTTAVVSASIPDSGGIIHACRTNLTGAIRIIDSASTSCSGLETALNWSQESTGLITNDFSGADLSHASLVYRDFRNTDFSNADMSYGIFNGDDLRGANLSGANLMAAHFSKANLSGQDFSNDALSLISINNTDLRDTVFIGAYMASAQLLNDNLSTNDLSNVNFSYADLHGSDLSSADVTNVTWGSTTCPDSTSSDSNGGTCVGHLNP